MWPGYMGLFIRRPEHSNAGDEAVPAREAVQGRWGLVPHWSKVGKERNTFNARSETVATKPSFRKARQRSQRCIIPSISVFEPDWRSGKSVSTQIASADGQPMGIAGLWSAWISPNGLLESYTMLTVNADQHELMQNFHKPDEEKRMVVILPQEKYADWLKASPEDAGKFMQSYRAGLLQTRAPAATNNTLF